MLIHLTHLLVRYIGGKGHYTSVADLVCKNSNQALINAHLKIAKNIFSYMSSYSMAGREHREPLRPIFGCCHGWFEIYAHLLQMMLVVLLFLNRIKIRI